MLEVRISYYTINPLLLSPSLSLSLSLSLSFSAISLSLLLSLSLSIHIFKGAYWISSNSSFIHYCSPFSYRSSNFAIAKLSLLLALKSDSEEQRLNYCSFSLLKAIAICLLLLFANAFKCVKERQLLLSQ